tara:strand:+ start:223 stop:573 length:351 start_codon:yes stop_codon:yes gene_type:complete
MFNDSYDGKIDELNYISFMNNTTYGNISFNLFVEKKDELCVLEKYYVSLLEKSKKSKKSKFIVKSKQKQVFHDELNVTSEDAEDDTDADGADGASDALYDNNDGNLSDDLDKALGL